MAWDILAWARNHDLYPCYKAYKNAEGFVPCSTLAFAVAGMFTILVISVCSEEPFTYIDRAHVDKVEFEEWLQRHQGWMAGLHEATNHIWFGPYCMLHGGSRALFLHPSTAEDMLCHWKSWVAEQD